MRFLTVAAAWLTILVLVLPVIRRLRQVTVKFQVDEAYVPAL